MGAVDTSSRGVWKAPWRGPNGEPVALVLDSHNHLIAGPIVETRGGKVIAALWDLLNAVDPQASQTDLRNLGGAQ